MTLMAPWIMAKVMVVVAMMMQALYNTVDSMYVARISEGSFAAVTLAFPVQMIIGAMSTGIGVGINSSISRHLGAGEKDEACKAASNGISLGLVTMVIMIAFVQGMAGAATDATTETGKISRKKRLTKRRTDSNVEEA